MNHTRSVSGQKRENAVGVSRKRTRRAGPSPLLLPGLAIVASVFTFGCDSESTFTPSAECQGKGCNSSDTSDDKSSGNGRTSDRDVITTDTSGGRDSRDLNSDESTWDATTDKPTASPAYVVCDPVTDKGCGGEVPWCVGEGELGADGGLSAEPRCVECEADAHCEFPYVEKGREGVCVDNRCACDTETHRGCGGETPGCVEAADGKRLCVACASDEHCTSPVASRCDLETNLCVECNGVGQCAHLGETPACDVERGRCVECTPDEDVACDGRACNAVKGSAAYQTCSEFAKGGSRGCEECVSNEQCAEGHECVHETVSWLFRQPTGRRFCMAVAVNDCADNAPFLSTRIERSMSGEEKAFCKLRDVTCTSYALYGTGPDVVPEGEPGAGQATCQDDVSCGYDWIPGRCVAFTETTNRCSYACQTDDDCPRYPSPVPCANGVCALL